jgi:hypothetical protein
MFFCIRLSDESTMTTKNITRAPTVRPLSGASDAYHWLSLVVVDILLATPHFY